jgi:hypothetical protein
MKKVKSQLLALFLVILAIFLVIQWLRSPLGRVRISMLLELITGWTSSARRIFDALDFTWLNFALWVAALFIALSLMHSFFRWLQDGHRTWRLRSTAIVFGLLGILLIFAMSAVGIAHQAGWWLTTAEPKWDSQPSAFWQSEMEVLDAESEIFRLGSQPEYSKARDLRTAILRLADSLQERMFISVFESDDGVVTGVLIAPRDTDARTRTGIRLIDGRKGWADLQSPRTIRLEDVDNLISGKLAPVPDQRIRIINATDASKLTEALADLGVDPEPFVKRLITNSPK